MSKKRPETISLEQYRKLLSNPKQAHAYRPARPRTQPAVCAFCGQRIGTDSTCNVVEYRDGVGYATPYHLACYMRMKKDQENPPDEKERVQAKP